ncbi:alpha-glucosidase/alpha-galactosidase [bacterium]|nr:alpha-glucosidase/alpha-galactosidase [bacterium]
MNPIKIVLIGAGSYSFGLMTVRDLMQSPELHGSHLALVDIAENKLARMTRLVHRMNHTWDAGFEITSTTDRCEALPGADIVVVSIERKRYEMWRLDIEIPLKHGTQHLYGENGGPGGMFHTLRQVPPILEIARDMERLCPNAWFVNMSNPESRLCLALHRYTQVKNVGVCLGAYITQNNLATKVLGSRQEDIDIKVAGINHCHWVMDIRRTGTGEDLYPQVREKIETVDPKWEPLSRECLRRFGYYPGPADTHVGEYLSWGWKFMPDGYTDGIFKAGSQNLSATGKEREAKMEALASSDGPLDEREMQALMLEGGLRWQTLDIILSLFDNGNRYILSLNVPNDGYISNLKQDAIVEIPAIVGADRIYGLGMGALPTAIAAIMELQLHIMDLVVEAAVTGDRQTALEALIIDPNVPDPATAEKILDEMLLAQSELLPQFQ